MDRENSFDKKKTSIYTMAKQVGDDLHRSQSVNLNGLTPLETRLMDHQAAEESSDNSNSDEVVGLDDAIMQLQIEKEDSKSNMLPSNKQN